MKSSSVAGMKVAFVARHLTLFAVLLTLSFTSDAASLPPAQQLAAEIASGQHAGIESFVMQVDGEIVGRTVAPTLEQRAPDLRSATKSITALLIGIAIDKGAIPSVQSKVMDLLPTRRTAFENDPRKAA